MPYIIRDDGQRFVIPSYRDALSAASRGALKGQVTSLSKNYGQYVAVQAKTATVYEVAFSNEPGYLLGESIWDYLKKPMDMVYCESIPDSNDAILVIVKEGSVYLDGSFPAENIPEELVVFLTQENQFEIYTYGDVPLSRTPEENKFAFDAKSVKSFNVLDRPLFASVPLLNNYNLKPINEAFPSQALPIKAIATVVAVVALAYLGYSYYGEAKDEVVKPTPPPTNPFLTYYQALETPAPDRLIAAYLSTLGDFYSLPGWGVKSLTFAGASVSAALDPKGAPTSLLNDWRAKNHATLNVTSQGLVLNKAISSVPPNRYSDNAKPTTIYSMTEVLTRILDRIQKVYPGNHMRLGTIAPISSAKTDRFPAVYAYSEAIITITLLKASPMLVGMIGQQLRDLPIQLQSVVLNMDKNGSYSGSIIIKVVAQ